MRLVSAIPQALCCSVTGRKPYVMGMEEMRFPPKGVVVPNAIAFRQKGRVFELVRTDPIPVLDVTEADAEIVLEKYGRAGIVAVKPDEELEDALVRAMTLRLDFCRMELTAYREQQAVRQAGGLEILLPRNHHRQYLREMRTLQVELAADDVLTSDIGAGFIRKADQPLEDPMASELQAFGISREAAPMLPRKIDSLMDL